MEVAADGIKRLEAVVAGSGTRGAAGENILARALAQLLPDMLEVNVAFGNKCVEYALRRRGTLPADRQRVGERDCDRHRRAQAARRAAREVLARVREMTKYLDPERTLALGFGGTCRAHVCLSSGRRAPPARGLGLGPGLRQAMIMAFPSSPDLGRRPGAAGRRSICPRRAEASRAADIGPRTEALAGVAKAMMEARRLGERSSRKTAAPRCAVFAAPYSIADRYRGSARSRRLP
jgi:hypothetical protein